MQLLFKQSIYDKLSDSLMNKPSELWKTFKSVERKEAGGNSEVKELIAILKILLNMVRTKDNVVVQI
jgi:hypothetical protein